MHILKKPDLSDPKMRAKLAKGMGHNYYGEPAWPNDLLYIFPVVILGTIACVVGLAVLDPAMLGDKADPFATPLEILPEWYLYPVFQILRVVPNKLLGIALQTLVPLGLMLIPFIESFNKFQNPFRRPVAMVVFPLPGLPVMLIDGDIAKSIRLNASDCSLLGLPGSSESLTNATSDLSHLIVASMSPDMIISEGASMCRLGSKSIGFR